MNERVPLMAGNWKMNLTCDESRELVKTIAKHIKGLKGIDVLVAPPYTSLSVVRGAIGDAKILLAAQNMHWETSGAFTGEISGLMLREAGCSHVILGHSERRTLFHETSQMVDLKAKAAVSMGLIPIICVGETLEEREGGRTFEIIGRQLEESLKNFLNNRNLPASSILAYEPVWAIGTGKTATPEQAQEVHKYIREWLAKKFQASLSGAIRILYGGSVKADNVRELMSRPDIDGALVGGASLKADSFLPIINFRN
jgi:triosephosphate isomerase (TIM)